MEYRAPAEAIRLWVRALRDDAGSWELLERRVSPRMRAAGEPGYSSGGRTPKSWGEGARVPGGLAMVALMQEFPAIPLAAYALTEASEPPSLATADLTIRERLSKQLAKLERQIKALETLAPSVSAVVAVLLADTSLGPAIRLALERAHAGGVDPAAAQYLADAQTD